jgi:hypothetical protein
MRGDFISSDVEVKREQEAIERRHTLSKDSATRVEAMLTESTTVDGEPQSETTHVDEPDQEELDERLFQQALDPNLEYFDATPMLRAMTRRIRRQDATINRLANILEGFAQRQVAMNRLVGELKAAIEAPKTPTLILPERMN